jgi:isopenicillin N synthase-like dioxygenase
MPPLTTHHRYPSFPVDLRAAPLKSISLDKLESGDDLESSKFFDSCRNLGFLYLNLLDSKLGESILSNAESLHELQQEFYALPHEAKDQYGKDKVDPFFSYRWTPCSSEVKDVWGRPGRRVSDLKRQGFEHLLTNAGNCRRCTVSVDNQYNHKTNEANVDPASCGRLRWRQAAAPSQT